jgi:phosphatidylserine/phosphatidylglycerophosphate/cardiolipin synthase-like enzyme
MRRLELIIRLVLICVVSVGVGVLIGVNMMRPHQTIGTINATEVDVAFSPGNAKDKVMEVIGSCKTKIRMATYDFTFEPFADALIAKRKQGVDIAVVSDYRAAQSKHTVTKKLRDAGIPIRLNKRYAIHHHKFTICDEKIVETGSFNYTNGAIKRNAENVVVLWNAPNVYNVYLNEWNRLYTEAKEIENENH